MHQLRSDEPTLMDALNRGALVAQVGDLIATCETPHVFGVHGDWGAGKTSFLHQVQLYLTGECPQQPELDIAANRNQVKKTAGIHKDNVTVVWFEAWRYQHETVPVVALLQEMRSQLPWTARFRQKTAKLGEVAIRSALLAMEDLTKKIYVQASKIQEVGETWEKENLAVALPSHVIRQHLQNAIATLLGKDKGQRLVIVVDDLDRCSSDAAYRLLEGIKIYLNLRSCVFVLGMNQRVIEDAIGMHLPKDSNEASVAKMLRAREYLEKICQHIVHLPIVENPAALLGTCLQGVDDMDRVVRVARVSKLLPANPRKIKAFANTIRRSGERLSGKVKQVGDDPKDDAKKDHITKSFLVLAALYHFHPDIFRVLEAEPRFYKEIKRWASGETSNYSILTNLRLPRMPDGNSVPANPGMPPSLSEFFVDPGDPTMFRLQDLVIELGNLTPSDINEAIQLL